MIYHYEKNLKAENVYFIRKTEYQPEILYLLAEERDKIEPIKDVKVDPK